MIAVTIRNQNPAEIKSPANAIIAELNAGLLDSIFESLEINEDSEIEETTSSLIESIENHYFQNNLVFDSESIKEKIELDSEDSYIRELDYQDILLDGVYAYSSENEDDIDWLIEQCQGAGGAGDKDATIWITRENIISSDGEPGVDGEIIKSDKWVKL